MSSTIDIESKLNNNIYNPNSDDIKQFKLIVKTQKKIYSFFKNTNEKYCQLINIFDKINFNDLISFELIIYNKILNYELININHKISKENMESDECYIYTDSEIYIEFLKDNDYTNCYCYIKKLNSNINFNTPPNY